MKKEYEDELSEALDEEVDELEADGVQEHEMEEGDE